jgi:hypothetical protein
MKPFLVSRKHYIEGISVCQLLPAGPRFITGKYDLQLMPGKVKCSEEGKK